jgi:hypothetical protein
VLASAPSVAMLDSGPEIFWRGSDNGLWSEWTAGGHWNGTPAEVPGTVGLLSSPPSAVVLVSGPEVFWRGGDSGLSSVWTAGGHWNGSAATVPYTSGRISATDAYSLASRGQPASVGLGIGDITPGDLQNAVAACPPASSLACYQDIAGGITGSSNRFKYARIIVPWDTVASDPNHPTTNQPANCVEDEQQVLQNQSTGTTYWTYLDNWITAARAAGLDPLIALGDDKSDPTGLVDPNTIFPTQNEYGCAFKMLVTKLQTWAAQNSLQPPSEFEVFNEPDSDKFDQSAECQSEKPRNWPSNPAWGGSQCGALFYKAAVDQNLGVTLVAGSFNYHSTGDPTLGFVNNYINYLSSLLTNDQKPTVWSAHPYNDTTSGALNAGTPGTGMYNVDKALYAAYNGQNVPQVWVTEADDFFSDAEVTSNQASLETPQAQAYAAQAFLALPAASSYQTVAVTREYWWEFTQPSNPQYSGLIAPDGSSYEPAFCVLAGVSATTASNDPLCGG